MGRPPPPMRPSKGSIALLASLLAVAVSVAVLFKWSRTSANPALQCLGEYADSLQGQSARMRELEQGARSQYSYLVRSTAKYECPFFGPDGKLRRRRVEAIEHGTA